MSDQQTCGKGLAEHSALTASMGELVASTARVLEVHMKALDLTDENSKREYDAYRELASAHRRVAPVVASVAARAGQGDARHHVRRKRRLTPRHIVRRPNG